MLETMRRLPPAIDVRSRQRHLASWIDECQGARNKETIESSPRNTPEMSKRVYGAATIALPILASFGVFSG